MWFVDKLMKQHGMTIHFFTVLYVILSVTAFPVSATQDKITPFISFEQEYSDNVLFTSKNLKDDWIAIVSGGLKFTRRTEIADAGIQAKFDKYSYRNCNELNSFDKFFSGNFSYRITERFGITSSADYSMDSRADRELTDTGLIVPGDRKTKNCFLSCNYAVSEITKADITFNCGNTKIYTLHGTESDNNIGINLRLSRNMSKIFNNTTGVLDLSFFHYTTEVKNIKSGDFIKYKNLSRYISDIFQFSTGFSKDITELCSIYFNLGASYTKMTQNFKIKKDFTAINFVNTVNYPEYISKTLGGVIAAGLKYKGLYRMLNFSVSRDMHSASGTNGAVQRSAASINFYDRITDKFRLLLYTSCYLNQNKRENHTGRNDLTLNLQPGFRYKFKPDLSLAGFYKFTSIKNRRSGRSRQRNMIYFVIKKQLDF